VIAGLIIGGSIAFAVVLGLAWLGSPGFRAWLEAPKHRFQSRVRDHDRRSAYADPDGGRST